ncbi:hypothetical protein LIER_17131 [Lithospermum erythrorhizon]|uniref:Reverse transcriptase domain-containing protein n=1 Tax=Lithospermum erythrorhizon TaxID=34254 RepID=A0AAV3QAL0_LITER
MCFISTVSHSVLINGAPLGYIRPTRGIRQGDPLSPYIFLLCAEGLMCMLREVELRKSLTGIKISRESPSISHILFADDTMIFCKAVVEEGNEVMRILKDYEVASGQKINRNKCSVSYDAATPSHVRHSVTSGLGVREVTDQRKYLGLPSHIGRSKREVFSYLNGKVETTVVNSGAKRQFSGIAARRGPFPLLAIA